MGLHIAFHRLQIGMPDAAHIVSLMPEEWLPVESSQMICILGADAPGAGALQIVNQHGDLQGRMDVNQQMQMIRLAAKLQ